MATLILVRHGRTTANAEGVLAGRTRGIKLDDHGREQSARAAERIAPVPLAALVTSPLTRCRQTAAAIADSQPEQGAQAPRVERGLTECDYGDWTGRVLKELSAENLWQTIQRRPSAVTFPGGESMVAMQARAIDAVRRVDAEVEAEHGSHAAWAAVSHGDVIKAVLADALGLHLDLFQRLHVEPGSISVVRYGPHHPQVLTSNSRAGDLAWLVPTDGTSPEGAQVGGGDVSGRA